MPTAAPTEIPTGTSQLRTGSRRRHGPISVGRFLIPGIASPASLPPTHARPAGRQMHATAQLVQQTERDLRQTGRGLRQTERARPPTRGGPPAVQSRPTAPIRTGMATQPTGPRRETGADNPR